MSGDGAAAFFWLRSASQPQCLPGLLEFLSVRLDVKPRAQSQNTHCLFPWALKSQPDHLDILIFGVVCSPTQTPVTISV